MISTPSHPKSLSFSAMLDSQNVCWLVIATVVSSVTASLFYAAGGVCGHFFSNSNAVLFQKVAAWLDVRSETLYDTTNLFSVPRVLQDLGLFSHQVCWNHDANARTGDCVQWGVMLLPTKSYLLTCLGLFGFSHYVYVAHNFKSVTIVGPRQAIASLINISNLHASSRLPDTEILQLREAFGMGEVPTRADELCCKIERRGLGSLLFAIAIFVVGLERTGNSSLSLVCALVCFVGGIVVCVGFEYVHEVVFTIWSARRPEQSGIESPSLQQGLLQSGESLEGPTVEQVREEDVVVETSLRPWSIDTIQEDEDDAARHDVRYYAILVCRNHFYESLKQNSFVFEHGRCFLEFQKQPQLFAIPMQPNFVRLVAMHVLIPEECSLNICVHNPMTDPPLDLLYSIFQKGVDLENVLVIVLPPFRAFRSALCTSVFRSNEQPVNTLSDFACRMLQITSGFMPKMIFIFPTEFDVQHGMEKTRLWQVCEDIFGSSNCVKRVDPMNTL